MAGDIALGANAGAMLIGWVITGIGIIALGLVFQNLSIKKPDLDSGIYSYAKEGFGKSSHSVCGIQTGPKSHDYLFGQGP